MNNSYLKLIIKSGITAAKGAALAAASFILNSDDNNNNKTNSVKSEKEAPQADYVDHRETALHTENSGKRQSIYVPDDREFKKADVTQEKISEEQAIRLGLSFRKKSKRIRITNYHGSEKSIIIPTYIDDMLVNEISANAFKSSCVERVAIPDSVKKLGESAFAESSVRDVVFGNGLLALPKMSFYNCKRLETIAIPPRTRKLGEKAFYGCESLKYIELPRSLYEVGEDCFCESGLEGFAAHLSSHFQYNSAFDGSAFANTPLHKNNKLILYKSYDPSNDSDRMKVLLVGKNAYVILNDVPYVYLGKNSVCAPCQLDFTECESFWTNGAFKCKPSYIDDTEEYSGMCVYVPDGYCGSFPSFVSVLRPRGGINNGTWCENPEEFYDRKTNELRIKSDLCSYLLSELNTHYRKNLTLVSNNNRTIKIENYAVGSSWLRKIRFVGEFIPDADSRIFDPQCVSLREVRWQGFTQTPNGKQTTEYIQSLPAYAVRPDVHRALLKAFCGDGRGGFFDPNVIEDVFDHGIIRRLSKTRMELSHREKILIATDVLRSSPELYPDGTEKYSRFLKRHIDYAKKMCGKLMIEFPEYLEFLGKFAPEKGDVQ